MRKLDTVRKSYVLNNVYSMDEPGPGGAHHEYVIIEKHDHHPQSYLVFQKGARDDPKSEAGITDEDLLEIVRDRLKGFQQGEFACEFNERALRHINEALYQLKLRAENRAERGVLGKMVK